MERLRPSTFFPRLWKLDLPWWVILPAAVLVYNLCAVLYLKNSATVYTWDNAGYWTVAATLTREPISFAQIGAVLQTVQTYDYNYLLAYPISLLMRLFGTDRAVFVLATVNLYFLPGAWGLLVLGRRGKRGGLLPLLAVPMLFYIALLGFVDVAAASCAIWAFVLYTAPEGRQLPRALASGVLLTATFLLRRYFFFFAASFGIGALAAAIAGRKWKKFLALFGAAAVTSLLLARQFLMEKILESSYSVIYSAYQLGLGIDLMMFARYFGLLILLCAAVSGVYLLTCRGEPRENALHALVQAGVCFFLLTRVQSHGSQHLLLYAPAVALLIGEGVSFLPDRRWARICAAGLLALCTLSPLLPRVQPKAPAAIRYPTPLPSFSYAAPRRDDIAELLRLHAFVDGLSAGGQKTAAVVASSLVFNNETYTNLYPSLNRVPPTVQTPIIHMTGVDKRDGFSWNVLTADYLLVGDPVQTHLGEENQQVMAILAHDVLDGVGVGNAYEPLDETFTLDGGCTVRIFRRTRAVTEAERQSISARLIAHYPDFADLYRCP